MTNFPVTGFIVYYTQDKGELEWDKRGIKGKGIFSLAK